MISRDEQRARAAEALSAHLLRTGLAQTSLRQLAAAAGVSDRMLLYYFRDKAEALGAATEQIAARLSETLADAIPANAAMAPGELVGLAAGLTTGERLRPYMRLWIEIVAAAARGEAPFVDLAGRIAEGFLQWIDARLAPVAAADRRAVAAAILAMLDGLALLEVCAGAELTGRAAREMGGLVG
jgi:AcrR family transcriptional regulator